MHRLVLAPKRAQAFVMKIAQIEHAPAPAQRGAHAELVESGLQVARVPGPMRSVFGRLRGNTRGLLLRRAWQ